MVIGTRLRELLAELAELRERAKLTCERSQRLRRERHDIVETARAQSRRVITVSRRLVRPDSSAF
jgi:uncharacterized coiled-coil DUF342 family protein